MNILKILTASVVLLMCACEGRTTAHVDYLVTHVNIVPMDVETVLYDQNLAIKEGKLTAIYSANEKHNIIAKNTIDGTGRYLMPGLADMHSHMRMPAQAMFNIMIANGVTTTAHMRLGDGANHTENRMAIEQGKRIGPRFIVGGPMLSYEVLESLSQVEAMLDRHIREGYDFIKIHDDLNPEVFNALIEGAKRRGLRVTGHTQRLAPMQQSFRMTSIEHIEEFLYVTREGLNASPASFQENIPVLVEAYLSNLNLLSDSNYRKVLAKEVAESGIYITPTLAIFDYIGLYLDEGRFAQLKHDTRLQFLPKQTREDYLDPDKNPYRDNMFNHFAPLIHVKSNQEMAEHFAKNLDLLLMLTKDFFDAGVPMLLGADAFGALIPGISIHQELELLVKSGLTPYQALRTGTINVAEYLGESSDSGTIAVGKKADFILLEGNPLDTIENTSRISGVFTQGQWHSLSDLARLKLEVIELVNTP